MMLFNIMHKSEGMLIYDAVIFHIINMPKKKQTKKILSFKELGRLIYEGSLNGRLDYNLNETNLRFLLTSLQELYPSMHRFGYSGDEKESVKLLIEQIKDCVL